MTLWSAPASAGVNSALSLPGSKSLTNRYLVLGAIGSEPLRIGHPLVARDTELMADALQSLGVRVDREDGAWTVHPGPISAGRVECGLAGTVMRFIPALAAHASGDVELDGDLAARVRPMGAIVDGLRELGVNVDAAEHDGGPALPLTISGSPSLRGGTLHVDASASSQFISGLLLTAPLMRDGLDLRHVGEAVPSTPHIRMTVELLREAGINVVEYADDEPASPSKPANRWVVMAGRSNLTEVEVEPDLSNAGPFLAAAMVAGGRIVIERWPLETTQPGDSLRDIFTRMGAHVRFVDENTHGVQDLELIGPDTIAPLDMDMHDVGELVPTVAAVCAFAEGESRLRNIGQLRGHETDRLAALVTELGKIGVPARESGDDLIISPTGKDLTPAVLESYEDHRMATFGAIIGLRVPGTKVTDIATTSKTLPTFTILWEDMLSGGAKEVDE